MSVMLGVLPGSMLGARILMTARTGLLRVIFAVMVLLLGIEMIRKGLVGSM
jgi:hypothetical protein